MSPGTVPHSPDAGDTPLCGSCRAHGFCRLGVGAFRIDEAVTRADVVCAEIFHAGPNVAHGGWTAAMFDDVMGRAVAQRGVQAVTSSLAIGYLKPVPIETPLTVEVAIGAQEGRRLTVTASLRLAGDNAVLATAKGVWVERRQDHFERHEMTMNAYRQRQLGGPPAHPVDPDQTGSRD